MGLRIFKQLEHEQQSLIVRCVFISGKWEGAWRQGARRRVDRKVGGKEKRKNNKTTLCFAKTNAFGVPLSVKQFSVVLENVIPKIK